MFWLVGWCGCLQLGPANSADFVSAMQAGATAWLPSPLTAHMLQAQIIAQVGMHAEKWQAFLVWLCRTLHGVWYVVCDRGILVCAEAVVDMVSLVASNLPGKVLTFGS